MLATNIDKPRGSFRKTAAPPFARHSHLPVKQGNYLTDSKAVGAFLSLKTRRPHFFSLSTFFPWKKFGLAILLAARSLAPGPVWISRCHDRRGGANCGAVRWPPPPIHSPRSPRRAALALSSLLTFSAAPPRFDLQTYLPAVEGAVVASAELLRLESCSS